MTPPRLGDVSDGLRRRSGRGPAMLAIAFAIILPALAAGSAFKQQTVAAAAEGTSLTIYSSLPLQGANRIQNEAVVNGIKLALEQAGGKAGGREVRYISLDDSTAQAGNWDPGQTSSNARKAAQDEKAIGYIGEFNSGASAVSMPILNQAGLAQVSPTNTYTGLTADERGIERGDPDRYYPTGRRHYARIVPRDTVQGAALALLMARSGCRRVFVLHDGEIYGRGLALSVRSSAPRNRLRVVGFREISRRGAHYRRLAASVRRSRPRCVFFGGVTANGAVPLFRDIGRLVRGIRLFGGDGIAESEFTDPREGGVPQSVARRVRITINVLGPSAYPPAGRQFFRAYVSRYPDAPLVPYAIYGYEAMSLLLDAIDSAGPAGNQRAAVVDALFGTRDRPSVLGKYSIDPRGDTSLTNFGVYRIARGALFFDSVVKP